MNPLLVLASASPFRRALLENAGLVFEAKAAKIDERTLEKPLEEAGAAPETVALALAEVRSLPTPAVDWVVRGTRRRIAPRRRGCLCAQPYGRAGGGPKFCFVDQRARMLRAAHHPDA